QPSIEEPKLRETIEHQQAQVVANGHREDEPIDLALLRNIADIGFARAARCGEDLVAPPLNQKAAADTRIAACQPLCDNVRAATPNAKQSDYLARPDTEAHAIEPLVAFRVPVDDRKHRLLIAWLSLREVNLLGGLAKHVVD